MSRWHSYLKTAEKIILNNSGKIPLAEWLKEYFRLNKQMGSTDRRIAADLVYSYYRLGHAAGGIPIAERIMIGSFLCSPHAGQLLQELRPEWVLPLQASLDERLDFITAHVPEFVPGGIFPWKKHLSDGLDPDKFNRSFLVQPDLFLRVRPGRKQQVVDKLTHAGLPFEWLTDDCIVLPNSTKINDVIAVDADAVVQDYSSQKVGAFMNLALSEAGMGASVWDCCAGSGGKSIMAHDLLPSIHLTVSDVRLPILQNLTARFEKAGISGYKTLLVDLTHTIPDVDEESVDCLLADVPCTGSGTWSRTPEQLYFFDESRIAYYAQLQQRIVSRAMPALKKGGLLVYITCSVFRDENERMVAFLQDQFPLELVKMELLTGYEMKADSMFAAILRKV